MVEPLDHPRCHLCRHYYVTWEPRHPYGCRHWGFKSVKVPSMEVFSASGKPCLFFEPKPKKAT